ncbi:MAG: exodeoxyribonuclease III [Nakamurella sp.]
MLRITSHNVNGIRAAVRRGYRSWVDAREPDVICLQEVRAPADQVPAEATDGYHFAYHEGDRAGRNGVAVLTREEPTAVRIGFGSDEFDAQGRYIEVDLPQVTVASLYLPKGDVYGEKFEAKMRFMTLFAEHIRAAAADAASAGREFVVCGDFNIAHTEADIKAWKTNRKSEGFLPEERAWYGAQLRADAAAAAVGAGARVAAVGAGARVAAAGAGAPVAVGADSGSETPEAAGGFVGFVDVLRLLNPEGPGPYSWWSWRGKAFDNDAGWRIDHHWATRALAQRAIAGVVDRAPSYAERISDHAPVTIDYDIGAAAGAAPAGAPAAAPVDAPAGE